MTVNVSWMCSDKSFLDPKTFPMCNGNGIIYQVWTATNFSNSIWPNTLVCIKYQLCSAFPLPLHYLRWQHSTLTNSHPDLHFRPSQTFLSSRTVQCLFFGKYRDQRFEWISLPTISLSKIFYSHETSSVAFLLNVAPRMLLARHWYTPLSSSFLLCTARRKNRLPSGRMIRWLLGSAGAVLTCSPSLYQSMMGSGSPVA